MVIFDRIILFSERFELKRLIEKQTASSMNIFMKLLSYPYRMAVSVRHWMFDCGLLKSEKFSIPIICVGNITVGGTGKTPHTEMLVRTLLENEISGSRNIAVLSRGYKRKSKGFQQVVADGTA
jgi:tetraacyldisaccharide 4'-kinase